MVYIEASVRRQQIVAAARRVMERSGVAGASMRTIAAEAEIPLGTLQYVFPARELLLDAVFESVIEELERFVGALDFDERPLSAVVELGAQQFWAALVSTGAPSQLMQLELIAHSLRTAPDHLAPQFYERYVGVVAAGMERVLARSGERLIIPTDQLARMLVAAIDGIMIQFLCSGDAEGGLGDIVTMMGALVGMAVRD